MTWAKGDDRMSDHPKILALSDAAFRLWWNANVWCNKHLTDGHLPEKNARALMALQDDLHEGITFEHLVAELTTTLPDYKNPLWITCGERWTIHDFLEHNPSRKEVEAARKQRSEAGKRGGKRSGEIRRKSREGKDIEAPASKTDEAPASRLLEPRPDPTPLLLQKGGGESGAQATERPAPPPLQNQFQDLVERCRDLACYNALICFYDKLSVERLETILEEAVEQDGIPHENFMRLAEEAVTAGPEREPGQEG